MTEPTVPETLGTALSENILGTMVSESSFLSFLFHPRTTPRPKGLRKRRVTGRGKGRKASRIRAFNKLDPVKQRAIDAAGREKYLRGEMTLVEARRSIRPRAVEIGVAKPVPGDKKTAIDNFWTQAKASQKDAPYREAGRTAGELKSPVSFTTIVYNVREMMTPGERERATRMTYTQLRAMAIKRGRPRVERDTGEIVEYNPFWYH